MINDATTDSARCQPLDSEVMGHFSPANPGTGGDQKVWSGFGMFSFKSSQVKTPRGKGFEEGKRVTTKQDSAFLKPQTFGEILRGIFIKSGCK